MPKQPTDPTRRRAPARAKPDPQASAHPAPGRAAPARTARAQPAHTQPARTPAAPPPAGTLTGRAGFMTDTMWLAWLLRPDVRGAAALDDPAAQRDFLGWWCLWGPRDCPEAIWIGPEQIAAAMAPQDGVPALLRRLHADRADLHETFPLDSPASVTDFLCWYRLHGVGELAVAPPLPVALERAIVEPPAAGEVPPLALAMRAADPALANRFEIGSRKGRTGLATWFAAEGARLLPPYRLPAGPEPRRAPPVERWLHAVGAAAEDSASLALAHALALLALDEPEAGPALLPLAEGRDVRLAWFALAEWHWRQDDIDAAASAAAKGLSRHAADAARLPEAGLDALAAAAGLPGWCALLSAGAVHVRAPDTVTLEMDGAPVAAGKQLPDGWPAAARIAATSGDAALLGSPLLPQVVRRVEGFVDSGADGLAGWAWYPNDPATDPLLRIAGADGAAREVSAAEPAPDISHRLPFARPRRFRVPAAELPDAALTVTGADGRALYGSPVDPFMERRSAAASARALARRFPAAPAKARAAEAEEMPLFVPVDARLVGPAPKARVKPRPVDVVIPVYGGAALTYACIASVRAGLPSWARILVVDDASPDPALAARLDAMAAAGEITLLRHARNAGFPSAVNTGMRADPARDVVLLNSDTLAPPGWLERMRAAAYSAPDIGSVTPLSNDATILSYPSVDEVNPVPDLALTAALDRVAEKANGAELVDLPTAVGFAMYIRRDCLEAAGVFRTDLFAQGYGEENDFCLRARHLGWRHVGAAGIFVAHVGGHSFGPAKTWLIERNSRILNRLHPGYDRLIQEFIAADPLAPARRRMDMLRWQDGRQAKGAVILVTHGREGGVRRRVEERAAAIRASGRRAIVLRPHPGGCTVADSGSTATPNLNFTVPGELGALAALLKGDKVVRLEVHSLIGHDHALLGLAGLLGVPYDVVTHDYAWLCPRINLVGREKRYCGEPDLAGCNACVADAGATIEEPIATADLRARSAAELGGAARVVAPSADMGARLRRYFPALQPELEAWEADHSYPPPIARPVRRIAVIGAIGIEKGYEVLLGMARDAAARNLPLDFALVGFSCDDERLRATGRVAITGRYRETEALGLIRSQRADFALIPSVWPETWCYTLTQAWQAGLDVAAFDLGAQAERIRRRGRGLLFPLHTPPAAINTRLLMVNAQAGTTGAAGAAARQPAA
jgi:GT2 family glycosyltransferase